jgi:hypothetical protein
MNKFSTLKIADSDTSPFRAGRCDDNGVMQVTLVSSDPSTSTILPESGTVRSFSSFARPNDTLPYLAGDVLGTSTSSTAALEFTLVGRVGKVIRVTGSRLEIDIPSIPSGMTSFRLHLYSIPPPSAYVDSTPWDLPASDRNAYLGYVDLGSPVDLGATLYVQQTGLDYDFLMGTTTSLYGYLVTSAPFTPSASTVKVVTLYSLGM